jgi:PAS domain S-box-containing protein
MIGTRLNILLAEDEPAHVEAIRRAFPSGGNGPYFQVARTLGEYRGIARTNPPDIALVDLNMPDGRAVDVIEWPPENNAFPVLIMTSYGDQQVAVEALKAGALDYIVKSPETFQNMPRIVDRALREWDLLLARRQDQARIVHLNSVLRGIRNVNQLITKGRDRVPLMQDACDQLVDMMGYQTVWIALGTASSGLRLCAHAGMSGERADILGRDLQNGIVPDCVEKAFNSGTVVGQDIPEGECQSCVACETGLHRGVLAAPMQHLAAVYGAMIATVPSEYALDPEEQALFQELVGDISSALYRIELEEQHRKSQDALEASEARFRDLIENLEDVIFSIDSDGRIQYMSPAVQQKYGYTPAEIVGHHFIELIHPEDLAGTVENLQRVLAGSAAPYEFRGLDKEGQVRHLRSTSRVRLENGVPVGVNGVVSDITAEVLANREREKLQEHLRMSQKLEAVGRLAGGVAHDFNNLLGVIINYADFVIDELDEASPARNDVIEIRDAGRRAAALVRQLLAFSRKQILEPEVLNLNRIIRGIENLLRRLLGEDMQIILMLDDGLGSVLADPGQIEQVVVNLAVNARDAMPKGGKLIIQTSNVDLDADYADKHFSFSPGPYVMLSVTDTGCGMDAQTRQNIFEPFFTTKERDKGTGLGLATVYGIVKQSGGYIWVYSEPGHGSVFKVYLPWVDAPETESRRQTPQAITTGTETVLIVEDEDSVRKLAERILGNAGYTILSASSGEEALALCATPGTRFDLLLTDMVMPRISGSELADRLSAVSPPFKVLFMSGYSDHATVRDEVQDSGALLVVKPFSASELTRRVRAALDNGPGAGGNGGAR